MFEWCFYVNIWMLGKGRIWMSLKWFPIWIHYIDSVNKFKYSEYFKWYLKAEWTLKCRRNLEYFDVWMTFLAESMNEQQPFENSEIWTFFHLLWRRNFGQKRQNISEFRIFFKILRRSSNLLNFLNILTFERFVWPASSLFTQIPSIFFTVSTAKSFSHSAF